MLLARLIDREAAAFRDPTQIRIDSRVSIDLKVMIHKLHAGETDQPIAALNAVEWQNNAGTANHITAPVLTKLNIKGAVDANGVSTEGKACWSVCGRKSAAM